MTAVSKMVEQPEEKITDAEIEEAFEEMPVLNRDAILSVDESDMLEAVEIPEWKGIVYVRVMSGAERDSIEEEMSGDKRTLKNFRARFAVKVLSDERGTRLFSDSDADKLGTLSGRALDRILKVGLEVNGFSESAVDELEKN